RPSPTTAATVSDGSWTCSVFRQPSPLGATGGSKSPRTTPTTCPRPSGSSRPSPSQCVGNTPSTKQDGQPRRTPLILQRWGGRHDQHSSRPPADRGGSGRPHEHVRAVRPPSHHQAAHRLRQTQPSHPHHRSRYRRLHRLGSDATNKRVK